MPERIGRRTFLGTAGRIGAGAVLGSLPLINGCKGGSTTPDDPDEPAVPVDLDFTVYNHTQGPRGTFRRTGVMSGTAVELSVPSLISDLGIGDVYDRAICIRESVTGIRVASSRTGGGAKFLAPRQDTNYDAFLFNVGGEEFYRTAGTTGIPLQFGPTPRAFRIDNGIGGEERVWGGEVLPEIGEFGAIDQLNNALKPEWAPWSYGHIERKPAPNDGQGEFAYGFGDCRGYGDSGAYFAGVFFPVMWTGIDPTLVPDIPGQVARGLGILTDCLLGTYLGGRFPGYPHTWEVVQENGILKEAFRDFLPYAFLLG